MHKQLRIVARKHGFAVNVPSNPGEGSSFADFIIVIDDSSMLGLKLRPALSTMPFELYPYGKLVGLDDIEEVLSDFALRR